MAETWHLSHCHLLPIVVSNLPNMSTMAGLGSHIASSSVTKKFSVKFTIHYVKIRQELFDRSNADENFLKNFITGDESWVYVCDVETTVQSSQWMGKLSPRPKKARQSRSNMKVMLIVFFDWKCIVHYEFVQRGETVNKEFYLNVLKRLREEVRRGLRRGQTTPGCCTITMQLLTRHSLSVNF